METVSLAVFTTKWLRMPSIRIAWYIKSSNSVEWKEKRSRSDGKWGKPTRKWTQSRTSRDNKLKEIYIADRVKNLHYEKTNVCCNNQCVLSCTFFKFIFIRCVYRTNNCLMNTEVLFKLNIRFLLLFNRFHFFYAFHVLFSTLNVEIQNETWQKMKKSGKNV